jgi:hypothetical protein
MHTSINFLGCDLEPQITYLSYIQINKFEKNQLQTFLVDSLHLLILNKKLCLSSLILMCFDDNHETDN